MSKKQPQQQKDDPKQAPESGDKKPAKAKK